mmetsp:Transcript_20598/g.47051  ORF Transcript_20598/g.47051 Transcript_20598/m.47051 type:complete len:202 (-) Transcript_20598:415-1020(-)
MHPVPFNALVQFLHDELHFFITAVCAFETPSNFSPVCLYIWQVFCEPLYPFVLFTKIFAFSYGKRSVMGLEALRNHSLKWCKEQQRPLVGKGFHKQDSGPCMETMPQPQSPIFCWRGILPVPHRRPHGTQREETIVQIQFLLKIKCQKTQNPKRENIECLALVPDHHTRNFQSICEQRSNTQCAADFCLSVHLQLIAHFHQ